MNRTLSAIACVFALALAARAGDRHVDGPQREWPRRLAIVTDADTARVLERELGAWRAALEADGWGTWLVTDSWTRCEDVRDELRRLAGGEHGIAGAVLVGNVPQARMAYVQHLASAGEVPNRVKPNTDGIVSETYFSDFDLVFDALTPSVDEFGEQRFAVNADSPQVVERELFVARVRASGDGEARRKKLTRFFEKAAQAHQERRKFEHAVCIVGQGESSARYGSWVQLENEMFPDLRLPGRSLRNVALAPQSGMDEQLSLQILDRPLDLLLLRRVARDARFLERVSGLAGRQRLVVFDASAVDPEIAQAFLFGASATVVVASGFDDGSVSEARLALLGVNARIGSVHVLNPLLDARLFGDPTFAFDAGMLARVEVNVLEREGVEAETLTQWLAPNAPPALRARAIEITAGRDGPAAAARLVESCKSDASVLVRLTALEALARARLPALTTVFETTIADPSDELRAATARLMGEIGRRVDLPRLLRAFLHDESPRVVARAKNAIFAYDLTLIGSAVDDLVTSSTLLASDTTAIEKLNALVEEVRQLESLVSGITQPVNDMRSSPIPIFRELHAHRAVPALLEVATDSKFMAYQRRVAIEALGWFQYTPSRDEVIATLRALAAGADVPDQVRTEATRSARRLADGPTSPLDP